MTDHSISEHEVTPENHDSARKPERSMWGLLGIVVLVIILVLILMLLRDCAGEAGRVGDDGDKTIESVNGYAPVPGSVSVWIAPGADISQVLAAADVAAQEPVSLGGGRYVLTVEVDSEAETVEALASQDGVYDAGLVYDLPGGD